MKFYILQVKKSTYIEWAGFRNGGLIVSCFIVCFNGVSA